MGFASWPLRPASLIHPWSLVCQSPPGKRWARLYLSPNAWGDPTNTRPWRDILSRMLCSMARPSAWTGPCAWARARRVAGIRFGLGVTGATVLEWTASLLHLRYIRTTMEHGRLATMVFAEFCGFDLVNLQALLAEHDTVVFERTLGRDKAIEHVL